MGRTLPLGCICIAGTSLSLGYLGGTSEDYGDKSLLQALLDATTTGIPGRESRHLAILLTVCARGFAWSPGGKEEEGGERAWERRGKQRPWIWGGGFIGILGTVKSPVAGQQSGPTSWHQAAHSSSTALARGPLGSQQPLHFAHWFS